MLSRILAMAFVCVIPGISQAQLPSQPLPTQLFPSIHYLGRYLGVGYGDGYHACKDGRGNLNGPSKNWNSVSTFYGSPTLPPNSGLFARQTVVSGPISVQGYYVEPMATAALQNQMVNAIQNTMPIETGPTTAQPHTQSQSSPSDRGIHESDLSAPLQRPNSNAPEAQLRRLPAVPGSYSLIQPTSVRAR